MMKVHYSESASASEASNVLSYELASVINDLHYLTVQEGLVELVSGESIGTHSYIHLQNNWIKFSQAKEYYDQLRWLDLNGKERLRINFNNGQPASVTKDQLQNKANRYYFSDTIKLRQKEVFISPLDLNIENGKVEQPLKPMIRLGSPVFDRNGNKQGIVLINYTATKLLDRFVNLRRNVDSEQWLLNSDGYWLKGSSSKQEWGFMLNSPKQSMGNQYPNVWKRITASDNGQFMDEYGLWTFDTVYPLLNGLSSNVVNLERSQYYWKTVLFIPNEQLFSFSRQAGIKFSIATIVILIGFYIAIWLVTKSWDEVQKVNKNLEGKVKERTQLLLKAKECAERLAKTDELTGINNRRAFFDFGNHIHEQASRYEHSYCILMLDLDLFKNINDTYGHKVGDDALIAASNAITEAIRASDVVARIGGEEFGVILPETAIKQAEDLAERIRTSIEDIRIPLDSSELITFTVSIGVSGKYKDDSSIDEVLARADKALYQAKEQGRNQTVLFG